MLHSASCHMFQSVNASQWTDRKPTTTADKATSGCSKREARWSILQPAALLRVCRFEGNLVWCFSYGAVEADRDLFYLFRCISVKRTCWPPFRSWLSFHLYRKICFSLQAVEIDCSRLASAQCVWLAAVEIIAKSCLSEELVLIYSGLSVWLPTSEPCGFISLWVLRSQFYSSLHMQITPENNTSYL